jgi:aminoglycoside/choline kinase family phosphotransferase
MQPPEDLIPLAGAWLEARGLDFVQLERLAGDVSARAYARVTWSGGGTAVLAHYPPDLVEAGDRFHRTASLLEEAAARIPAIRAWDREAGIMWLDDAGDRSLYDAYRAGEATAGARRRAVAVAGRISALPTEAVAAINPRLDTSALRRELAQSWRLVLVPRRLTGDDAQREALERALEALCERLGEAPPTPCHRDYMARNLMLDEAPDPIVLDHQDLRLGPPWYDLASLLNDSIYATADEEAELLDLARVPSEARQAYHRAAAQRALKIVGTFTAFAARGTARHLPLVAPSLRAARRHLLRLPETSAAIADLAPQWDLALAAASGAE